ncbi:MAG: trigger factor [Actinobacteria bacterium]|nr:trigger factor [Actinomycetota bacterium]
MKTEIKKLEGNFIELTIEVDKEEVAKAVKRAYRKVANEVKIPGFRKGKVPPEIIDVKVGKEVVLQEAMDELLNSTYFQAVAENKVKPIDDPEIDIVQFEEEKPMIYKAKIEVKPEFELPPIDLVQVEKKAVEVNEDEVNEQIEKLRERFAKLETKKLGEAKEGDYALISFEGFINGKKEEKASMQDFLVELGSSTLMPEFESQLFGTRAGDIKRFTIRFPEDHHEKSIAGKDIEFNVIVKEIKQKTIPEVNDEFAKEVGGFENLEDLKNLLRERIKEVKEQQAEVEFQNQILKSYVDATEVEIPEKLVEKEIDQMIVELAYRLAQQGLKLEDYLNYVQLSKDKLRESMREEALERAKTKLVLEKIAEVENIEVTEEDLVREINQIAVRWGVTPEEVKKHLEERNELDLLIYDIYVSKAYNLLIERYKEAKGVVEETNSDATEEVESADNEKDETEDKDNE